MKQETHLLIDPKLVGVVTELGEGRARAALETTREMCADARGLVHGGFTFALADFAVMCAVNEPNVVLGSASVRFLKPVTVGRTMAAEAVIVNAEGKKRVAEVYVTVDDARIFEGTMTAFVLPKHVLDM